MNAAQSLIDQLEALGYSFALRQGRLTASLAAGYASSGKAAELLEKLRTLRADALRILQHRADEQAGFHVVREYQVAMPVTLTTHDPIDALAIKYALDRGAIELAGKVEYRKATRDITFHYRPLVPPEWANLQPLREAAEKASKAQMEELLLEYETASIGRRSAIIKKCECLRWALGEVS